MNAIDGLVRELQERGGGIACVLVMHDGKAHGLRQTCVLKNSDDISNALLKAGEMAAMHIKISEEKHENATTGDH